MNQFRKVCFITLVAFLVVTTAFAGTKTASIAVTANIQPQCTIVSHPLAFGNYDPLAVNLSAALDQATTINVTCVAEVDAIVTLDQGLYPVAGSTAAVPLRKMQCLDVDGEFLNYFLYKDSAHLLPFGGGTSQLLVTGVGTMQTFSVFGEIPGGQMSEDGGFADTVVATVSY